MKLCGCCRGRGAEWVGRLKAGLPGSPHLELPNLVALVMFALPESLFSHSPWPGRLTSRMHGCSWPQGAPAEERRGQDICSPGSLLPGLLCTGCSSYPCRSDRDAQLSLALDTTWFLAEFFKLCSHFYKSSFIKLSSMTDIECTHLSLSGTLLDTGGQ